MRSLTVAILAGLPGLLFVPDVGTLPPAQPLISSGDITDPPLSDTVSAASRDVHPKGQIASVALSGGVERRISSLLTAPDRMPYGSYIWQPSSGSGSLWVMIDLKHQILSVFRNGDEIGSTVILYGMTSKPTPVGAFPILAKAVHHRSSLYEAEMPYMMRLTKDGISIHAANVREAAATHGCLGVPLEFAKLLFAQTRVGDVVYIVEEAKFLSPSGQADRKENPTLRTR